MTPEALPPELGAVVQDVLDRGALRSLCGSGLFSAVTTAQFSALSRENKVEVQGKVLLVDPAYALVVASSERPVDERRALLAMYVVHEAVHRIQGIGAKDAVARLRETGNEIELMHRDLEADNIAFRVVSGRFARWDPLWLRDIQGRSISDFPLNSGHAPGSRWRKPARQVALRIDYHVRVSRPDLVHGEGYVYAVLGNGAGPIQVWMTGSATRMLFEAVLDEEGADALLTVLDDGDVARVGRADAVLRELLGSACPEPSR